MLLMADNVPVGRWRMHCKLHRLEEPHCRYNERRGNRMEPQVLPYHGIILLHDPKGLGKVIVVLRFHLLFLIEAF